MPEDQATKRWTPLDLIAFRPTQVSFWVVIVYVALLSSLFTVHLTAPPAPLDEAPELGLSQTQAWRDLQELSKTYRPWNSARNGEIKTWLSRKIKHIVASNHQDLQIIDNGKHVAGTNTSNIILWNDNSIDVTIMDRRRQPPMPAYIESQNILLYVRGYEDEKGAWWERAYSSRQGVLVNAHYDSVSTGYGATDDGCGVISILQLISYFTVEGHQPRRGIIFLLNDGEEDGLYGAHTFSQHPWSSFPGVFLNLEGAGAGGRAALFRSTDAKVTSFYSTPHPFGTVFTGDGFKRGLVRSDTDYSVMVPDLDISGLDVAFQEPRSRYHTDQDAARDTSPDSLWHMLSMALDTTKRMSDYDGEWQPLSEHTSDAGVWFDIYGSVWVVTSIHGFAALSITLLVMGPLVLGLILATQIRQNRLYLFASKVAEHGQTVNGARGFFRTPIALLLSILASLTLSDLIDATNPLTIYRSPWQVLAMFLNCFLLIIWTISKLADHIRPAIFTRWYSLFWTYLITWVLLVVATHQALADGLGSGYLISVLHLTTFLALLIGTLELYSLPPHAKTMPDRTDRDQVDERTSLLNPSEHTHQTFTGVVRPQTAQTDATEISPASSVDLPSWTWLIQFLLLALNVVSIAQVALLSISGLHQTPADGNSISTIYLVIIGLSALIRVPVLPFIHKLRATVAFLLVVMLVSTAIWNTTTFPFSREARLKYFFVQQVDLQTGTHNTSITAVEPFLFDIIAELPSAAGQKLQCSLPGLGLRRGLTSCFWNGLQAEIASGAPSTWVDYNITEISNSTATFGFQGKQTKNCWMTFDQPVKDVTVIGAANDKRNPDITSVDATQIRLFSREYDKRFELNVTWPDNQRRTGRLGCRWAELDAVPAAVELKTFAPTWSTLTKQDDGLVEAYYDWELR